jgi:hypothetical protein
LGYFFFSLHIESQIILDIVDIPRREEKKQFQMTGMLKKLNPSEMKNQAIK